MAEVGRLLKFATVEILQEKIDRYFLETNKDEWTITGLALALDTSRRVLVEYGDKEEFSNAIRKAKLKVENGYEIDLKKHGRTGTIFALKNFDWTDKREIEHTGDPIKYQDVSKMSKEEVDEYLKQKLAGGAA